MRVTSEGRVGRNFFVRILGKVFYDKTDAACIVLYRQQLEAGMMKNQSVRWEEALTWFSRERSICLSLQGSEKLYEPLTVLHDHLDVLRRGKFYIEFNSKHANKNLECLVLTCLTIYRERV